MQGDFYFLRKMPGETAHVSGKPINYCFICSLQKYPAPVNTQMSDLKKELYDLCVAHVRRSMDAAELAIQEAQKASNDDTKSSAGDKYETGRAMMQQETNRNLAQLNEANKLMVALNRISTNGTSAIAELGSVIITNNGNFYLAISAGSLPLAGKTYFAVSPGSPVGLKLNGKKKGDSFTLNSKLYVIELVS